MKLVRNIGTAVLVTIIAGWLVRVPEMMETSWKLTVSTAPGFGVAKLLFNKVERKYRSICDSNSFVRFLYRQECLDVETVPKSFKNLVVCGEDFEGEFKDPLDALIAFKNRYPSCLEVFTYVDRKAIRLQADRRTLISGAEGISTAKTETGTDYYFCGCSAREKAAALSKVR